MKIIIVPYRDDNYGFLIEQPDGKSCIAVDAGDDRAYFETAKAHALDISAVLITHHHQDHVSHLHSLASGLGEVYGPEGIPGTTQAVKDGDMLEIGGTNISVIGTPGHTIDMVNFYIPSSEVVFTGDTLFTLGCGRIFEGTPGMMFKSLQKLAALPNETLVYGAHEYALANLDFALSEEPNNDAIENRGEIIRQLRVEGKPTVPSTIGLELATNPFLRAQTAEEFTRLRAAKDAF